MNLTKMSKYEEEIILRFTKDGISKDHVCTYGLREEGQQTRVSTDMILPSWQAPLRITLLRRIRKDKMKLYDDLILETDITVGPQSAYKCEYKCVNGTYSAWLNYTYSIQTSVFDVEYLHSTRWSGGSMQLTLKTLNNVPHLPNLVSDFEKRAPHKLDDLDRALARITAERECLLQQMKDIQKPSNFWWLVGLLSINSSPLVSLIFAFLE